MTDADAQDDVIIDILPLSRQEATRVASGVPGPDDRWAAGFPREDDREPAAGLAGAPDPGPDPFGVYRLVPRAHGLTIGTAGFYGPPDAAGTVTIGYGMVEPEWGRGYGTAAVAALITICRERGRVKAIEADTEPANLGSRRVLEKNGFQLVRTTGTQCFYALRL